MRGIVETLEQRMLLAAAPPAPHGPAIDFGGKTRAVFLDASGDTVTVSLSGAGSGVVRFNQTDALATNLDALSIELTGTDAKSSLSVKVADATKGDIDDTNVQQITVTGSLGALSAPAMNLSGAGGMTVSGTLGAVTLKNATGTISVQGASTKGSSFTFAGATDLTLTSPNQGIAAIKAAYWHDTGSDDQVAAPLLGTLRITDVFEPSLTLGSDSTPDSTRILSSATIGSSTQGAWTIHGSVGPITVGSSTQGDWTIDGSATSISVGHFGGNVTIGGAVASLKTRDNVGLIAGTGSSQIQLGGKASVSAASDHISVKNGATLYTQTAAAGYDLSQIAGYDDPGRQWSYDTTYSGALGSGAVSSSTWIQSSTVYTQVDNYTLAMNWMSGSFGPVLDSVNVSADALGTMSLMFSPSGGTSGGLLPVKGTVTSTVPVTGTWTDPLGLDAEYGSLYVGLSGDATLSLKSMGYEEVDVPYGHYLAYKVEMKIAAKGPLSTTVQGQFVTGRYNVGLTQTLWCVPGIGVVKQQGAETIGFSAAGKSGSGTIKSTMLLQDYTG